MISVSFFNEIVSVGVVLSQIFIVLALAYLLFFRHIRNTAADFLNNHGMLLAFIASLLATCGSLFYSQVIGFAPCELCWFQRIFMYPQVVLLGLALVKKDSRIIDYALSLSAVGILISLYHNYIYFYNQGLSASCQVLGSGVSCVKRYVLEFGYITIPVMALTAFGLVIVLLLFQKLGQEKA